MEKGVKLPKMYFAIRCSKICSTGSLQLTENVKENSKNKIGKK